jgi:hypothetical protein
MSLRKKDVYSKLSDYGKKVLGKSSDCPKDVSSLSAFRLCINETPKKTLNCKNILSTPTPPNSPNYKPINNDILIKTIEEPYYVLEVINETKPKEINKSNSERTSFKLCKIM